MMPGMSVLDSLAAAEVGSTSPALTLLQVFLNLISTLRPVGEQYPKPAIVSDGQNFDFIIIGAGSAGCVLANRLTEIRKWSVLVIEAGGEPDITSEVPGLFALVNSKKQNWNYRMDNDYPISQAYNTRNLSCPRGKMISGCSGNNFMLYVRGNKDDYDNWAEQGNKGWGWESVFPYFLKSEKLEDAAILNSDEFSYHNTTGYLRVTRPTSDVPLKYLEAMEEVGFDTVLDNNGPKQMGYSFPQFTIFNDVRQSTGETFMKPIKNRKNLHVLSNTLARKIIIDDNKAVGVEVKLTNDKVLNIYANKDVILSAGAYNSPQILMLSGIGPKEHLKEHDIDIILNSPKVGQNLQDHVMAHMAITGKKSLDSISRNIELVTNLGKFPISLVGYGALIETQKYPDYQSILFPLPPSSLFLNAFCSFSLGLKDEVCEEYAKASQLQELVFFVVNLLHPESRGELKLRSNNPEDPPLIRHQYYSNKNDLKKFVMCYEDVLKVLNSTYLKSVGSKIVDLKLKECDKFVIGSREYLECYIVSTTSSMYHPAGTCAMGPDGVVDSRLMVRGIRNLRVCDASVMPSIVSGNLNAPVVMIAEKASDMIKQDYGVI